MNAFIFVSVICIGTDCGFITSTDYGTKEQCETIKTQFLNSTFKPDVTLKAAACMPFKPGERV